MPREFTAKTNFINNKFKTVLYENNKIINITTEYDYGDLQKRLDRTFWEKHGDWISALAGVTGSVLVYQGLK